MDELKKQLVSYRMEKLDAFGSRYRNLPERYAVSYIIDTINEEEDATREYGRVILDRNAAEHLNEMKTTKGKLRFLLRSIQRGAPELDKLQTRAEQLKDAV